MTESWVQDWKHTSAPESVSGYEASTERRSRQRLLLMPTYHCFLAFRDKETSFALPQGQNHSPCTTGVPNTALFCLLQGPLLQLHSVQMEEYLHPHSRFGSILCILIFLLVEVWIVKFASGMLKHHTALEYFASVFNLIHSSTDRPIASIAFHANGELLAVASGHKLFLLDYNNRGEAVDPPMILKTRRSLRAVQFHPHAAPYLLTAEVHSRDSEDSAMTPALLNYAFRDIPLLGRSGVDNLISELPYTHNFGASSSVPVTAGSFDGSRRHDTPHHYLFASESGVGGSLVGTHAIPLGVGSERATYLLDSGTELPCTVKLRIWRHNMKDPFIALEPEACLLTIPHAVLCRFGAVLASRAVKAAHCLTSVQFSPTSEHILLAYGRQHNSLLSTVLMDGETSVSLYTVLEVYMVYRVSDMKLVRVLRSAGDEVNVACFHPSPGSGLVYGTKEGKLRFLQHSGANMGVNSSTGDNIHEYLE
nr:unnamed protein product [Digitaria exilis]